MIRLPPFWRNYFSLRKKRLVQYYNEKQTSYRKTTNILTRNRALTLILIIEMAPFLGRAHFCTTHLGIWSVFGKETYIHFVAQETSIIRKLFIF